MLKRLAKILSGPLKILENKYIAAGLKLFLILYASMIAPNLPIQIEMLLMNPAVKALAIFLIAYLSNKDIELSLLIAIGLILSLQSIKQMQTVDSLRGLINMAVDAPQQLANDIIDGVQDVADKGADIIGGPIPEVVGAANKIVDGVQGAANQLIDGVQDALL
jgi:hypothetical protein